jgi:hypothetical protein
MKPLGSDYTNGVNFAIAGSTATAGETPFSLDVQVDQFLFFKERCLELIDRGVHACTLSCFSSLLHIYSSSTSSHFYSRDFLLCHSSGETAPVDEQGFPRALYTIDIGHNDMNGILHLPYDRMLEKLPGIISEITRAVQVKRRSYVHYYSLIT